ncbi:transmembrane gamma-carboxyglutamic acid protein 3 [Colius striatus]|uniref:transmembrane gamma-carboxyglutamic acid protein 3 n=1 Tax=Colius striatus TaxID=57412 RepID=UPI002B1DE8A6|nr:transmembrane gamma-carboxyglutamic acid protein 3 [Colius striatus]
MEELCSYEEVKEVFEDKEKTMEFWKGYTNSVYSVRDPRPGSERSDAVYVLVPLLGAALLIVVALFGVWRCQLQKAARQRPSYAQPRCPPSRAGRSLPRLAPPRRRSHSQPEPGGRPGGAPQPHLTLCPPRHSLSVLSRLSGATPPPSYEEATGQPESGGQEAYSDPPPKYEEIVAGGPAMGK